MLVLGEALLGHSVKENKAYADPEMVERFNGEVSQAMRKDPIVAAPSDLVLVGRVMGLLSGVGKQLGSEVNLLTTLMPYLVPPNKNPDRVTAQEPSRG